MNVDLDNVKAELGPWEFKVKLGANSYPTRPLALSDLAFIESLSAGTAAAEAVQAFIDGLFLGPDKPDPSRIPLDVLAAMLARMSSYANDRYNAYVKSRQPMAGGVLAKLRRAIGGSL